MKELSIKHQEEAENLLENFTERQKNIILKKWMTLPKKDLEKQFRKETFADWMRFPFYFGLMSLLCLTYYPESTIINILLGLVYLWVLIKLAITALAMFIDNSNKDIQEGKYDNFLFTPKVIRIFLNKNPVIIPTLAVIVTSCSFIYLYISTGITDFGYLAIIYVLSEFLKDFVVKKVAKLFEIRLNYVH